MAERADRDPIDGAAGRRTDAPRGIFITFEGGEGAGKTTHIRFLTDALRAHGREVVRLREPGGTDIGERLRAIVLDPRNEAMSDEAELLVYEAAPPVSKRDGAGRGRTPWAVRLVGRFHERARKPAAYGRGLRARSWTRPTSSPARASARTAPSFWRRAARPGRGLRAPRAAGRTGSSRRGRASTRA